MEYNSGSAALAASLLLWLGALLSGYPACAQRMSAGVVVGRALTGGFHDLTEHIFLPPLEPGGSWYQGSMCFWPRSRDWVAGGMLELSLHGQWSLEFNALWRELRGQQTLFSLPGKPPEKGSPEQIVTWQFPILLKYRLPRRGARPFLAAGPAFRTIGNVGGGPHTFSRHGLAASGGVEWNRRGLRIAPTLRYTLWAGDRSASPWRTASDQLEALVTFSRAEHERWRPLGERIAVGVALGFHLNGDYPQTTEVHGAGTDFAYVVTRTSARSAIFGPVVEARLGRDLSLEAAALLRPIAWKTEVAPAHGLSVPPWTSRWPTWVFPVLLKQSLPRRGWAPFLALGPTFRMRQFFGEASPYGMTAAAGLRFHAGPVKISPSLRFTRWGENRAQWGPRRNQLEAWMTFSF
ncbi:MAG: hypothetical protein NZ554_01945 [Bryobacteraceae bacterium]|nr:hypothetical protein [Bryobacteraceae bacterium]